MPPVPTVFVVDDDADICDSLRELLDAAGIAVETYSDGESFLSQYDRARPGCLLLDIKMPGLDGLDLQDRMNQAGHTIPILILTGYADVSLVVRAVKAGALDVLEKPLKPDQLIERVKYALQEDRRTRAGQPPTP